MDHDHDLVHELSRRLDAPWRYGRRTADAEGHHIGQGPWRDLKRRDEGDVKRRKQPIGEEIREGHFEVVPSDRFRRRQRTTIRRQAICSLQ